jgi:cytochrome P450
MTVTNATGTLEPADSVPLAEIDLYPPQRYRDGDPHAAWRTLRRHAPLWEQTAPDGTVFWSVTRYEDVAAVLADTTRFSSEHSTMLSSLHGDPASGRAVHLTDPPRNTALRVPALRALSMSVFRRHQDRIRAGVDRLVDTALAEGELDFVTIGSALPLVVTGDLLGIPEHARPEVFRWTMASMAPGDDAYRAGGERDTLLQAHVFLLTLFTELVERRRAEPGEDVVSALVEAKVDGRPLSDDDVLANCYAVVMGAVPTLPQAAAQLVHTMAHNPDLWQALRADPALTPTAIEEVLRWASPVHHLLRRATVPITLHGKPIPAGGLVAAWLGSANRDEAVFEHPHSFDLARRPNPHLALGHGPHRCLGAAAVRLGMRLLVETLVARVNSLRPVGPARRLESNFLNGITSLPVAVLG